MSGYRAAESTEQLHDPRQGPCCCSCDNGHDPAVCTARRQPLPAATCATPRRLASQRAAYLAHLDSREPGLCKEVGRRAERVVSEATRSIVAKRGELFANLTTLSPSEDGSRVGF